MRSCDCALFILKCKVTGLEYQTKLHTGHTEQWSGRRCRGWMVIPWVKTNTLKWVGVVVLVLMFDINGSRNINGLLENCYDQELSQCDL